MAQWRYRAQGGVYGPIDDETMRELVRNAQVPRDAIVRREDEERWLPLQETRWAADIPEPPKPPPPPQQSDSSKMGVLPAIFVLGAIGFALWSWLGSKNSFSDGDISRISDSVRREYSARPNTVVTDVKLMRKSDRELIGYVNFKISGTEASHECTANMAEDGKQSFWRCRP